MESALRGRKQTETFVSWKEAKVPSARRFSSPASSSKSGGKGTHFHSTKGSSGVALPASTVAATANGIEDFRVSRRPRPSLGGQVLQSSFSRGGETTDAVKSKGKSGGNLTASVVRRRDSYAEVAVSHAGSPSHRPRAPNDKVSPLRNISANTVQVSEGENPSPHRGQRPSFNGRCDKALAGRNTGLGRADEEGWEEDTRRTTLEKGKHHRHQDQSPRFGLTTEVEVECNRGSQEYDDDNVEDEVRCDEPEEEMEDEPYVVHRKNINDNGIIDSEEDKEEGEEVHATSLEVAVHGGDMDDLAVESETSRRRERRREQSMREKEGDKRKKEGRPRNFLLVDEYTRKPYGPGVGDWRKELMLLSNDLDPSVGNINQHPEGAVAEIAEWIQHTWEYSAPLRFEYVKEVIARGVTLRRAALWKKLCNDEPKPEKMFDRTWRTLRRQMETPTQVKKFENCSRANASRVNFGRTGPSGEIGVRQRLRGALRRSPDPEEIQQEMTRDKGYGGALKRKRSSGDVMHGSRKANIIIEDRPHKSEGSESSENDAEAVGKLDGRRVRGEHEDIHRSTKWNRKSSNKVGRENMLAMTSEEIAEHPLVMKMMQRLEALEGHERAKEVGSKDAGIEVEGDNEHAVQEGEAVQKSGHAGDKVTEK